MINLLHSVSDKFIHVCDGFWFLLMHNAPKGVMDWVKKIVTTVVALLFVSIIGGAFSTFLTNRDQDKDIVVLREKLQEYKIEQDGKISILRDELRDQRQSMDKKLTEILSRVR